MRKNIFIWWLNPINIYIGITIVAIYAFSISEKNYWLLYGVKGKYIEPEHVLIYILSACFFCFGCKTAKTFYYDNSLDLYKLEFLYKILWRLCICAYGIWFVRFASIHGVSSFLSILDPNALVSKMYNFRYHSGKIAGITSMTEFGVVLAPLSIYTYVLTQKKVYIMNFVLLCFLATIRAALFSERLALLELLVPALIVLFIFQKYKKIYTFIPFAALFCLFVVFGIFEYTRSWGAYYSSIYNGSYVEFVIDRVLGYYAVAVNTECTSLTMVETPFFPKNTLQFVWLLPLLKDVPSLFIQGKKIDLLGLYGNPEFNNPGGLLFGFSDFGYIGLLISFIFGRITGLFYNSMIEEKSIGIIIYPIFFLCIIELPRYFYFGNNRAFYILIGIIMVCKVLRGKNV